MPLNVPTPFEGKSIATKLCSVVREYFKDETHRKEFCQWYEQKYGKPYTFKKEVKTGG